MITFVTGQPGDGKTMYGMRLICRTIMTTDRIIVTNIAVKIPQLRAYLISIGWKPRPGQDLAYRLIILDHEEVFEFYRIRSGGYVLPPSPDWTATREGEDAEGRKIKKLTRYKFLRHMTANMLEMKKHPRALVPIEYHIDEAHDYFSAREWADTGRGILWYASKHRHLHDEIVLYTQVMKNVEGQLRGLASETVRCRNQMRMSWGPFRKAPIFRLFHYYGAPEKLETVTPYNTSVMQLDAAGLASTYNSAGALNVHSTPEAVKNKAPLPYWALPVAIVAVIVLGGLGLALAPTLVGKWAGGQISGSATQAAKTAGASMSLLPRPIAPAPPRAENPQNLTPPAAVAPVAPLFVTGVLYSGSRFTITLSDGRTFTERDAAVKGLDRRGALIDGKLIPMKRPETVYPRLSPSASTGTAPVSEVKSEIGPVSTKPKNPSADEASSWRTDPDGVQRLKQPLTW